VAAPLSAGLAADLTHGFDDAHAAQTLPFAAVGKPADVRALPVAPGFDASVSFLDVLAVLVVFEGEHVFGVGFFDLAGDAPLAAHRIQSGY
jgi:hypothetical protein